MVRPDRAELLIERLADMRDQSIEPSKDFWTRQQAANVAELGSGVLMEGRTAARLMTGSDVNDPGTWWDEVQHEPLPLEIVTDRPDETLRKLETALLGRLEAPYVDKDFHIPLKRCCPTSSLKLMGWEMLRVRSIEGAETAKLPYVKVSGRRFMHPRCMLVDVYRIRTCPPYDRRCLEKALEYEADVERAIRKLPKTKSSAKSGNKSSTKTGAKSASGVQKGSGCSCEDGEDDEPESYQQAGGEKEESDIINLGGRAFRDLTGVGNIPDGLCWTGSGSALKRWLGQNKVEMVEPFGREWKDITVWKQEKAVRCGAALVRRKGRVGLLAHLRACGLPHADGKPTHDLMKYWWLTVWRWSSSVRMSDFEQAAERALRALEKIRPSRLQLGEMLIRVEVSDADQWDEIPHTRRFVKGRRIRGPGGVSK